MAQLGERCLRMAEAAGSNPAISTRIPAKAPEMGLLLYDRYENGPKKVAWSALARERCGEAKGDKDAVWAGHGNDIGLVFAAHLGFLCPSEGPLSHGDQ